MAEDAGKIDQYTRCEVCYDPYSKLHETLFPDPAMHKGHFHYAIVCRALLGRTLHTRDGKIALSGGPLFATEGRRELVNIPTTGSFSSLVPHHSLVRPRHFIPSISGCLATACPPRDSSLYV
jgi:hypothetical protein